MAVFAFPELLELARHARCLYVDHRSSTGDAIAGTTLQLRHAKQSGAWLPDEGFVLATCLRLERYSFAERDVLHDPRFEVCSGIDVLKRLISIACGLQSELVGEREILHQLLGAVDHAHDAGRLSSRTHRHLAMLFDLVRTLRAHYRLDSADSYATIAGRIFEEELGSLESRTFMVIGAGHMTDRFLLSLGGQLRKLVWVNRDLDKARRQALQHPGPAIDPRRIVFQRLKDATTLFPLVDGVLAAVGGAPRRFTADDLALLPPHAVVIDLSHPHLFEPSVDRRVHRIGATRFSDHQRQRPSAMDIAAVNAHLEALFATPAARHQAERILPSVAHLNP